MAAARPIHSGMDGHRLHELDQPLDDEVRGAAEIARDAAHQDAEEQAQRDADEADRHRNAGAVDRAAEDVAAEPVGADQVERLPAVERPEQVDVGVDEAEELVRLAVHEQADVDRRLGIVGEQALAAVVVDLGLVGVDMRLRSASPAASMMPRLIGCGGA